MAEPVALAGGLPKHDSLNGLVSLAGEAVAVADTTRRWVAIVVLDVKKVTNNLDTHDVQPTFRVVQIEPVGDEDDLKVLQRLRSRAQERRTGRAMLPLDLEDSVNSAFEPRRDDE